VNQNAAHRAGAPRRDPELQNPARVKNEDASVHAAAVGERVSRRQGEISDGSVFQRAPVRNGLSFLERREYNTLKDQVRRLEGFQNERRIPLDSRVKHLERSLNTQRDRLTRAVQSAESRYQIASKAKAELKPLSRYEIFKRLETEPRGEFFSTVINNAEVEQKKERLEFVMLRAIKDKCDAERDLSSFDQNPVELQDARAALAQFDRTPFPELDRARAAVRTFETAHKINH